MLAKCHTAIRLATAAGLLLSSMSATVQAVSALAPVGAGSGRARMRNQRTWASREEAWRAGGPTRTKNVSRFGLGMLSVGRLAERRLFFLNALFFVRFEAHQLRTASIRRGPVPS